MSGVSSKKQSETESFASLARTNQGAVWQELRRLWLLFLTTNAHLDWQCASKSFYYFKVETVWEVG